ncbi:hypothetical protein IZ6_13580 [Terrihabitans soli]|uniref:Secretin/TonB short N-terminal domain-containing protein n=1 Tax=Terrihabitans soli TaxID=708113 RepID=A0A6S6QHH3_9HYPH|nr:TonB-dependent receptor [Terrihabitans soli]BCJ90623.1 hypothetical protein IZ6_13580 [Terrihabitans soli]
MRVYALRFGAVLWASTMLSGSFVVSAHAQNSAEQHYQFSISSQRVSQSLNAIGRTTGLSVVVNGKLPSVSAQPVSGHLTARQAISAALAGTGLTYSFTNGNTVTVFNPNAGAQNGAYNDGGSVQLETINVSGATGNAADVPYQTPGSVGHISEEQIQRFRGTSPGDIFKNAPGVLVGENRNSGAVDVNIRGMQGVGRVPVTVDGALNTTTVYRGYQGVSSRTFIDPDFIGGVDITKGPSFGAGGAGAIGGTVAMRTVNADDILLDGKSIGAKVRAGFGTNTTEPEFGRRQQMEGGPGAYASWDIERPDWFEPTSGFGSAIVAGKSENAELVAGWSHRASGNYHAGENGDSVAKATGATTVINGTTYPNSYSAPGLTPFLGGEEVLNTSQDTTSILLKGTVRGGDGHALEIGFNHSDSEFGENYPAGLTSVGGGTPIRQGILSESDLKSYTARYRWDPSDTDAVDVRWNAFHTSLVEYSKGSASGLQGVGKWVDMYGTDISNTSIFDTAFGALSVEAGGSYLSEATGPEPDSAWVIPPPREGERWEASAFSQVKWTATDWLMLDGGLRYQRYRTEDKISIDPSFVPADPREGDALGYSLGATVTPFEGVQLFGSYKDASRLPSLLESARGFLLTVDPDLGPETAHNWEFGVNLLKDDLAADGDRTAVKFAFFDNTIDDYISRRWTGAFLILENIHQAHFQGLELSGRHETNFGLTAELAGTYYTDVTLCRTADTCINSSLASDYGTNYVPPEYQVSLTLTQKLFDDALTFGGRVSYTGPRAAGAEKPASGGAPLIAMIDWDPYTLVDLFAEYKVSENAAFDLSIENLGDIYYVEPLSLALVPAPGRTIRAGFTSRF